jgi:hypothetical protein
LGPPREREHGRERCGMGASAAHGRAPEREARVSRVAQSGATAALDLAIFQAFFLARGRTARGVLEETA